MPSRRAASISEYIGSISSATVDPLDQGTIAEHHAPLLLAVAPDGDAVAGGARIGDDLASERAAPA